MTNTDRVEILPIMTRNGRTLHDSASGVVGKLIDVVMVYGSRMANVMGSNGHVYTVAVERIAAV